MYERAAIPLPDHSSPPKNVDRNLSLHRNGELTGNYVALKSPEKATEEEMRLLRHGYFACVSYVDAQIGKVLDELERLGLRETTLVVVWGDHGFHLGDLYVWGKHTTFDFSLRSALLLSLPIIGEPGRHISDVVESADLYPTLADYCGLTPPEGLDGVSLRPALESGATLKKKGAYGYWRKGEHRAVTLRTPEYRLVEWKDGNGKVVQMELYDHQADPYETVNVAEVHPDVVTMLRRQLPACFG
jgi:arylsulfatase A-like enzyme